MKARRRIVGVFGSAVALMLLGCGLASSGSYRVRTTVEVETPQGIRSGSSVMEVYAHRTFALTSEEKSGSAGLKGEAVVVDLPGGPLFITLKVPDGGDGLGQAMTFALAPGGRTGHVDDYIAKVRKLGGWFAGTVRAELPREDWPMMVRFRDLNDPRSVEMVDPVAIGVKRIVVETTGDAVTAGIKERLGWLSTHIGSLVKRPTNVLIGDMPEAQRLTVREFITEFGR